MSTKIASIQVYLNDFSFKSTSGVDKIISSLEDGGNTICSKEYDET